MIDWPLEIRRKERRWTSDSGVLFFCTVFCWQTCFDGRSLCLNAAYKGTKRTQSESAREREGKTIEYRDRLLVQGRQTDVLLHAGSCSNAVDVRGCTTGCTTTTLWYETTNRPATIQCVRSSTRTAATTIDRSAHKETRKYTSQAQHRALPSSADDINSICQLFKTKPNSSAWPSDFLCTSFSRRLVSAQYCYFSVRNGQLIRSAVHGVSKLQ